MGSSVHTSASLDHPLRFVEHLNCIDLSWVLLKQVKERLESIVNVGLLLGTVEHHALTIVIVDAFKAE